VSIEFKNLNRVALLAKPAVRFRDLMHPIAVTAVFVVHAMSERDLRLLWKFMRASRIGGSDDPMRTVIRHIQRTA